MDDDNGNMLKHFNDPSYTMTDEEDIYDPNDGTGATYGHNQLHPPNIDTIN